MKKLLIIMNPCSGKKKANSHLADVISVFNCANYEVTVYMTTARGDGTTVAAQHGTCYDLLVCIGGDGTFNEVITGLHNIGATTPIGYIPAGSTNDFANSLHLSKDIIAAAKDITVGNAHSLDIGKFNQLFILEFFQLMGINITH